MLNGAVVKKEGAALVRSGNPSPSFHAVGDEANILQAIMMSVMMHTCARIETSISEETLSASRPELGVSRRR